eukprot:TRINITY_DN1064_c0_g1_i7.p1 TRINITY_DN1064_c0_g1~~TRINITY_DN1064_c0_g1_i7.p1  ORF type:complete len:263 (-),score=60.97 TRINITY_DN1064_c0_g1_i7:124-882(-)
MKPYMGRRETYKISSFEFNRINKQHIMIDLFNSKFKTDFKKSLFLQQISSIFEVSNPSFQITNARRGTIGVGWHGTSRKCTGMPGECDFTQNQCNLCSILLIGFKKELSRTNTKSFKENGDAIYATNSARFADFYSHGSLIDGKKALIFVNILNDNNNNNHITYKNIPNTPWNEMIIKSNNDHIVPKYVVEYETIGYNTSFFPKRPIIMHNDDDNNPDDKSLKADKHSGTFMKNEWSCCRSTVKDSIHCNYD